MKISIRLFVSVLIVMSCSHALAEKEAWLELGIGLGSFTQPEYPGSEEQRVLALPFPAIVYRSDRFKLDRGGLENLFSSENLRLDLSWGGTLGVDADDNRARNGMDDIDPGFEVGPSLIITLDDHWEAHLRARALFVGKDDGLVYEGWLFNPKLSWVLRRDNIEYSVDLKTVWADQDYNDFFYGVHPRYATALRPAYNGESGYGGVGLDFGIEMEPAKDLRVIASMSYYSYDGTAFDDSPLFTQDYGITATFTVIKTLAKWY